MTIGGQNIADFLNEASSVATFWIHDTIVGIMIQIPTTPQQGFFQLLQDAVLYCLRQGIKHLAKSPAIHCHLSRII